jgi:hypothetical protein
VDPSPRDFDVSELRGVSRANGHCGLSHQVEDLNSLPGTGYRSGVNAYLDAGQQADRRWAGLSTHRECVGGDGGRHTHFLRLRATLPLTQSELVCRRCVPHAGDLSDRETDDASCAMKSWSGNDGINRDRVALPKNDNIHAE